MPEKISESLLTFIVEKIDSIELLEVLVILCSSQDKSWSPEELDLQIRSSVSSIKNRLEYLCQLGIAMKKPDESGSYIYCPQSDELENLCENLVVMYREKRTLVTEAIYTKSFKEIVSFSRAFRIRKGK